MKWIQAKEQAMALSHNQQIYLEDLPPYYNCVNRRVRQVCPYRKDELAVLSSQRRRVSAVKCLTSWIEISQTISLSNAQQ
jgi:hypothetical protein